jgi:hypothetical protein
MRTLTAHRETLARLADLFQTDCVFDVARDGDYAANYLAYVRIDGVRYYCSGKFDTTTSSWLWIADDRIAAIAASPDDSNNAKYAYILDGNAKTYTSYYDAATEDITVKLQLQIAEGRFVLKDAHGNSVISTLQRRAKIAAAAGITGITLAAAGLAALKLRRKYVNG